MIEFETIYYGSYYLDDNIIQKPLEWYKIFSDKEISILLSKYVVKFMRYSTKNNACWFESSIFNWLNGEFLKDHFSEQQQNSIIELKNNINKSNGKIEKISLLTKDDVAKYLPNVSNRVCEAINYAYKNLKQKKERTKSCMMTKIDKQYIANWLCIV